MKKLLIPLLALSLLGCTKEVNVSNQFTYTHEFVERDYLPIVQGTLNGKKAYFLLDTGASISVLDVTKETEYGFRLGDINDLTISGYGGVTDDVVKLTSVDVMLGSESMSQEFLGKDIGYLVIAIKNSTNLSIVGIIGNNNIAGNDLILDFETNFILKRK